MKVTEPIWLDKIGTSSYHLPYCTYPLQVSM